MRWPCTAEAAHGSRAATLAPWVTSSCMQIAAIARLNIIPGALPHGVPTVATIVADQGRRWRHSRIMPP